MEKYDKLQLALVCAAKTNEFLDLTFGKRLISKKVLFRCSIISASILLITLSWLGFISSQPFGVAPWKSLRESIRYIQTTVDDLTSTNNMATFKQLNFDTFNSQLASSNSYVLNVNSNLFIVTVTTNSVVNISRFYQLGNGGLNVNYNRYFRTGAETNYVTNSFGYVTISTNPFDALCNDMKTFSRKAAKYDTLSYMLAYSTIFFLLLFTINAFLFVVSLVFCRVMLREIAATRRILSTASLIFTNVITVFSLCCFLLFFLTFLAIPLFWVLIPAMKVVADESLATIVVFLLSASITLWIMAGGSAKLVVLIAFLPSAFAGIVGLFTLLAIKWRNAFHFIVSFILIRCVEKSPILFLVAMVTFISGVLVELAHLFKLTAFL